MMVDAWMTQNVMDLIRMTMCELMLFQSYVFTPFIRGPCNVPSWVLYPFVVYNNKYYYYYYSPLVVNRILPLYCCSNCCLLYIFTTVKVCEPHLHVV